MTHDEDDWQPDPDTAFLDGLDFGSFKRRISPYKRRKPLEREKVIELIDRLYELERDTDPEGGEATEKDKFAKAAQALRIAHSITHSLTEWAQEQIYGITYFEMLAGDSNIDWDHHPNEKHWDYHSNEKLRHDIEIYFDSEPAPGLEDADSDILKVYPDYRPHPKLIRKTASRILGTYHPFAKWAGELGLALTALDDGEVFPILAPEKHNKGNKFTLDHLRNWAVLNVHALRGLGLTVEKAREIVAEKINFSPNALRKWERTTSKRIDPKGEFRKQIRWAFSFCIPKDDISLPLSLSCTGKKPEYDKLEFKDRRRADGTIHLLTDSFDGPDIDYLGNHIRLAMQKNDELRWEFNSGRPHLNTPFLGYEDDEDTYPDIDED